MIEYDMISICVILNCTFCSRYNIGDSMRC